MTAISLSLSSAPPPETDDGNKLYASFPSVKKVEEVRHMAEIEVPLALTYSQVLCVGLNVSQEVISYRKSFHDVSIDNRDFYHDSQAI